MYGEGALWLSSTANITKAGAKPFAQPIAAASRRSTADSGQHVLLEAIPTMNAVRTRKDLQNSCCGPCYKMQHSLLASKDCGFGRCVRAVQIKGIKNATDAWKAC